MRRRRRGRLTTGVPLCGAVLAATAAGACASLLGYDDLSSRSSQDAGPTEVALRDTDAESEDVVEFPAHPPSRPSGEAKPSGKGQTTYLIAQRFYLNSQSLVGLPSKEAWKDFGFDLDRVCTGEKEARDNTGTCKRVDGAKDTTLLDGNGCRDNNFGSQVIPLLMFVNGVFENDGNDAIRNGRSTWILVIEDLDDGPDDPYAPASLYKAANWADFGVTKPRFDGTDVREVETGSVLDGDLSKPKSRFAKGYVKGNLWVSGEPFDFQAIVPFVGIGYEVPLKSAVATVRLSEDHKSAGLGIMGGVITATDMEQVVRPIAGASGFCPESAAYQSILKAVATFMDVVVGAPDLQDTSKTCNGLSLGIGVELATIQPVTRVVTDPKTTDKCTDAGASDGDVPDGGAGDTKEGG